MRTNSRLLVAATLSVVVFVAALAVINISWASIGPGIGPGTVYFLGKDNETQGNWTNAIGSPIGVYGSYAHILPDCPGPGLEIPVGPFETPAGGFDWPSFGWTNTQIAGLPYNRTDPPYWDEYVSLMPKVNYTLSGTLYNVPPLVQYPVFEWAWDTFNSSDPRAAYFQTNVPGAGGPGTRLTCWDDGSERGFPSNGYFNITLSFPNEVFMLSLYGYDMERDQRDNQMIYITNTTGSVLASGIMQGTDFDNGLYLQFIVYGPTTIVVQVQKSASSANALLSGIFVDKLTYFVDRSTHNLDAEPPGFFLTPGIANQWNTYFNSSFDLGKPLNTVWDELYPTFNINYSVTKWCDANNDGILDPGDFAGLTEKVLQVGTPYWWHVDNVTVTMKVALWPSKDVMFYLELKDGWPKYAQTRVIPNGTEWYEVYPQYGPQYRIVKWKDNCDSMLDYCDNVTLLDEDTGKLADYHIELAKTDLIVSPRTTQIILGPTKDFIGKGYPQVIPVTIENYEPDTTNFTVDAYYNGIHHIGTQTLILNPLDSGNAIINWTDVENWQKGTYNYNISLNVYANGTLFYSTTFPTTFKITPVGDVDGNGIVDMKDIAIVAKALGTTLNDPIYDPNADVNCNCVVEMRDLAITARNFGNIDP